MSISAEEASKIKVLGARTAIKMLGGQARAAAKLSALTGKEVTRFRVNHWYTHGITAKFCPPVHQLTGVPLTQLDPEVYPVYLFAS